MVGLSAGRCIRLQQPIGHNPRGLNCLLGHSLPSLSRTSFGSILTIAQSIRTIRSLSTTTIRSSSSPRVPTPACTVSSSPLLSLSSSPRPFFPSFSLPSRSFSSTSLSHLRNIGISAHIDSGKTTLTERILYYTGRINEIHEVKGKDNVGATMDHMELEREKGITITSAATHCKWKAPIGGDHDINIIDTPGHVDFTIEVERSLRVLDGAIMVLCGVAGVQSQSLTVDRQMKRYDVPRIVFINKLDRMGANPWKGIDMIRKLLKLNVAAVQIPIGLEGEHEGVIDIIEKKAVYFDGEKGESVRKEEVPSSFKSQMEEKRKELIERVAEVDEGLGEIFMMEEEPTPKQLRDAIRRATIGLKFFPVFMGSAYKNKGVQLLLDGVCDYLPCPTEKNNFALDSLDEKKKVALSSDPKKPFVSLAFKLEEQPFGQLTYLRIYQGQLKRGDLIYDTAAKKKIKVQRVVKMHANNMEDVMEAGCGEIVAMFGIDCATGTTFTGDDKIKLTMTKMHVPEPVISLSLAPKNVLQGAHFTKALQRFQREDPTFRVHVDKDSQETIISGMGELHLEIYKERIKREYKVETVSGAPKVAYRESCIRKSSFDYTHKKQTGGAGQYGKVIGYIEPIELAEGELPAGQERSGEQVFQFVNESVGNNIPPEFFGAIEKGFKEAMQKGLAGYPVEGVRVVLEDGQAHSVDSSELSFKTASLHAFRQAFREAGPIILEPIMSVEIEVPAEFQGTVVSNVNKRKGVVNDVEGRDNTGDFSVIRADVPLSKMFGFSSDLRAATAGKGEFSMEYKVHEPITKAEQQEIMAEVERLRLKKEKEG